jgi:UDP-GlcNAc:undecaprenyl-phosphate GlcNAc-1-phosphate transferase
LLVLGVPIVDVAWIIVQRWRRGVSATQPGRDHLHHRLLELGLSQRQIVALYYVLCTAFGAMALVGPSPRFKLIALGVLSVGVLSALAWLSRKP